MSRPSSTSPMNRGSSTDSWLSSSISDRDQRSTCSQPLRSSPIAIVRNSSRDDTRRHHHRDSDDEDDDDEIQQRMSQLTVGSLPTRQQQSGWSARSNMARSMPSVPHAPVLTSRRQQVSSMPPSIALGNQAPLEHNEMAASLQSYGSLRESHMQGRFLDGPASYRDPSSGQIHYMSRKRVVRFDDSATSYQHPSSVSPILNSANSSNGDTTMSSWSRQPISKTMVSPGERMQEARKQRQLDEESASGGTSPASLPKTSPRETSTLSAMMEHAPKEEAPVKPTKTTGLHEHDHFHDRQAEQQNVLSTSLTGLELLQNSRRNGLIPQQQQGHAYSLSAVGALGHATLDEASTVLHSEPPLLDESAEQEHEQQYNDHLLDIPNPDMVFDMDHNPDAQEAFDLDLDPNTQEAFDLDLDE